jgi:putative nucleotidyltransferase with HDIG domain
MSALYQDVDHLIEDIVTLPSLPCAVAELNEKLHDPDCSLADVGEIVSADPAIAMKALRLVNSAYYGLSNDIGSVSQAVNLLGPKVIKNLVMTASVFESIGRAAEGLLRHSVTTGLAMRAIAQHKGSGLDPEEAFILGLLHDVGIIIFHEYLPKEHERAVQMARSAGKPLHEAETEIIGVNHADAGARLAKQWKLSPKLIGAIQGHHALGACSADSRPLAAMLHCAEFISTKAGFPAMPKLPDVTVPVMWETAGLGSRDIPGVLERFFAVAGTAEELATMAA